MAFLLLRYSYFAYNQHSLTRFLSILSLIEPMAFWVKVDIVITTIKIISKAILQSDVPIYDGVIQIHTQYDHIRNNKQDNKNRPKFRVFLTIFPFPL